VNEEFDLTADIPRQHGEGAVEMDFVVEKIYFAITVIVMVILYMHPALQLMINQLLELIG